MLAASSLIAVTAFGVTGARADSVEFGEQPIDGWETDGTVYTIKIIGGTAYIGGEFTTVKGPDGSALPRANLAAINMATGDVTAFRADTNGVVHAIEGDAVDLWIGGTFTNVAGLPRNRLAVLETATGAVQSGRSPGMSGSVKALRKSGSYMYVGGGFRFIAGVSYERIARLSLIDGTPDAAWGVTANAAVEDIAIPDAGDVIYLSGNFTSINGEAHNYLVGVSPSTGDVVSPQFTNLDYPAMTLDVTPSGDRLMAGLGDLGNRVTVWNPATGDESWRIIVGGDVQAVRYHAGNVYFGFHDGYQGNPFIKILSADVYTGSIAPWRPGIPSFFGVWAVDASTAHGLAIGGRFVGVEGIDTSNIAVFSPLAGPDSTPPSTPQNFEVTSTTETQISLGWDAASDNIGVTAYTVWRDGVPVGVTVDTFFDDKRNLPGDEFSYVVTAGDNAANESDPTDVLIAATLDGFVSIGDEWSYLDDGSDQGTAWYAVGFDDSLWPSGPAELGFGDGGEATLVTSGAITYYFRAGFVLAEAPTEAATMAVKRDDGAIVYVNGVEVWRDNMPGGPATASTTALAAVVGSDEDLFHGTTVPAAVFQAGTNEIAVEVHQSGLGSSDLSFDLALWGNASVDVDPPTVPTGLSATGITATTIDLTWNESTDDMAVTKYVVRRDGGIVGNVSAPGFVDTNLSPSTTYDYTVEAEDAAGNSSGQSAVTSATTQPDTTPPTSPAPLNIEATNESSVLLSWATSTDNVALAGYSVYRDGVAVKMTQATSYTDMGLAAATTYEYEVVAVDTAGNVSAPAGPVDATTLGVGGVQCNGLDVTILGTSGDDVITGTPQRDVIHGLGGNDIIRGGAGNDVICGGSGNDRLIGNRGRDVLAGGSGKDVLEGRKGKDRLRGNKGRDRLDGGHGDDILTGGRGLDEASFAGLALAVDADLEAGISTGQGTDSLASIERLRGSSRADGLRGNAGANRLVGRGGRDQIAGRGGDDFLLGKGGGDDIAGGQGNDLIEGGSGNDELSGGSGFDILRGGSGADICTGGEDVSGC
jgi:chitodextrinase